MGLLLLVCLFGLAFCQAEFCKSIDDPCEAKACAMACADCTTGCNVLEMYPVMYSCGTIGYSRYDVCPEEVPIFPTGSQPEEHHDRSDESHHDRSDDSHHHDRQSGESDHHNREGSHHGDWESHHGDWSSATTLAVSSVFVLVAFVL